MLKELWQTAHDICSLAACNIAFEDCKEEDGYDLGWLSKLSVPSSPTNQRLDTDAVWQIISICAWVVNFTERLMKACVLSNNSVMATKKDDEKGVLCVLPHPFILAKLGP